MHTTGGHDQPWCIMNCEISVKIIALLMAAGDLFRCISNSASIPSNNANYLLNYNYKWINKFVSKYFSKYKRQIIHKSVRLIGGLWTLKFRLTQKKLYRFVVVTEYNLLFNLQWVYSQILRVGKLLFVAWKETGCAYLWMKGLAWTLHPNKDHDPIWLPRHMVLFLRQRESVADSHLGWTE